jgi:serine/threonine protein kinase
VAAKSLRNGSFDRKAANSFIREALRMKNLEHPNVMTLIGICWGKKVDDDTSGLMGCGPLIVLPYTEMGDLRGYIRSKRRLACGSISSYLNILSDSSDEVLEAKEIPVPVDLLLKFGYQIGKGMDYISQQGIVHRDLAARNCMLTWDMKVKVSDFGLARALHDGRTYYRMGDECPLPVRWMAIESISDLVFSTESDIWSYGVTLWELFSLCTMPYAGMSNQEVMAYVQKGSRLEKPDICPQDIYDIMQSCWMVDVTERPKFPEAVAVIERLLGDGISYIELQPDIEEHESAETNVTDQLQEVDSSSVE